MHTASDTARFTHQAASLVPPGAGDLFSPYAQGPLVLPTQIVMAPLTRSRADRNGVPSLLAPEYYAQRASASLVISEAATVSRQGTGYDNGPGLYTDEQVAGWQAITDAVHEAGGRIFVQLFHAGRMSHPASPSAQPAPASCPARA